MKEDRYYAQNLDACIKCSACAAQCPVATVNPLFPGPKSLGPDAERLRLEGVEFDPGILEYCSNCKTCENVCPSGVKITDFILAARRGSRERGLLREGWSNHLRSLLLGRAEYVGRAASILPGLSNMLLQKTLIRSVMEHTVGISKEAPLPRYHKRFKYRLRKSAPAPKRQPESSQPSHQALTRSPSKSPSPKSQLKQVVYFPGCFATYNDPATAMAVVKILEHNGLDVIVPSFKCCGVPLEANGRFQVADKNSVYNIKLMRPYLERGLPLLTACTSCGLALKQDYSRKDEGSGELISRNTYDLFEFLWELHVRGELREDFQEVRMSCGYHAPCHLKAQGIGTPALRVLRMVPGVHIRDIDGGCCGFSGSYGFKSEKYPLANQIANPLLEKIRDRIVCGEIREMTTECGVCQTQISHGAGVKVVHPVWVLMQAYGLTETFPD